MFDWFDWRDRDINFFVTFFRTRPMACNFFFFFLTPKFFFFFFGTWGVARAIPSPPIDPSLIFIITYIYNFFFLFYVIAFLIISFD
jgi:hypothetical protein